MKRDPLPSTTSPGPAHLLARFAAQVRASPGAIAVADENATMSYAALDARSDGVARHLVSRGLAVGQTVGVLMERRADLVAVLLGIWKAAGAYVPFDPRDPADRVRRMLAASGTVLMIADAPLMAPVLACCEANGTTPPTRVDPAAIEGEGERLPAEVPDGLAYVMFTSGSTGEPKGVEIGHGQVALLIAAMGDLIGASAADRYLGASTIAFDGSIVELFLPLATGGSIVLRNGILLDPRRLAREVREHGITVVQTSPSVWQVILAEAPDFPRVRVAMTGGEPIAPALAKRLASCADEAWNVYGPTEVTVWATAARLASADMPSSSPISVPIGRPLPHVTATVRDDEGRVVPDGTPGDLCLGGACVARGYRGREALTRERFVVLDGERVYRTGDVVVRDPDGTLHFHGRNDDQVKVGGVRVEPAEAESAILADPRVAQAAATWFATPAGTRSIVAAVVLAPGAACRAQDLHEALARVLPSPMIPSRFLFVPWLPLTSSGKVDRCAVRQAVEAEARAAAAVPDGGTAEVPGRTLTPTEQAIARIWQRMLGVPGVAPDDHFFAIGGDSLTAVQMMVEVESQFDLVLPVHLAFEAPSLEALAQRVDRARDAAHVAPSHGYVFPLVTRGEGAPLFFCSVDLIAARRGLWSVPCPLHAVVNWTHGAGFAKAGSLEALAAMHVANLRRVQSRGPYRLAGYSFGGLVAYEMAQQLRSAGETVELLFLLDPTPPAHREGETAEAAGIREHLRAAIRGPQGKGWRHWLSATLRFDRWPVHPLEPFDALRYVFVNHHLRHPGSASRRLFTPQHWRAFWYAGRRMLKAYRARPCAGAVLVVYSRGAVREEGWRGLLPDGAVRHVMEVPHAGLFEEAPMRRWMTWLARALPAGGRDVRTL